ncbi:MAG: ATP synthase F1 subunit epsilon [Chloroflexota bacterium]|jgi:F-type H+-transporting ATPase subunit epsilon|nr:ATP synthase F1 subunit epsilon [Lentimicrobium sp.]
MVLEIITPEKTVFSGNVNLVQFPGSSGSFEVLKNHAPLVASLKKGKIKVKDSENKLQYFEINGGTVQVENNHILVLAD